MSTITAVFAIPGRTRWKIPGIYRNARLAAALEWRLCSNRGILQASASPLTGRMLVLFEADINPEIIRERLDTALSAALQDLRESVYLFSRGGDRANLSLLHTRRAQLAEVAPEESAEIKQAERRVRRYLMISLVSLGAATLGLFTWPALGVASVAGFLYVTFPVHKDTLQNLARAKVNISTLVTITSIGGVVGGHYWLINYASVIYVISRQLLLKIRDRSRRDLIDVFKDRPACVRLLIDSVEIEAAFDAMKPGDLVVVRAGQVVPADGIIEDGSAFIDQHMLTGEARPMEKTVGDQVLALTTVLSGVICVRVKTTSTETVVGRIGEILNHTADFKSRTELRAEALAEKTVVPTLVAGALALPILGPRGALGIIGSHFRHKVSAVAPIAMLNFLNQASHQGILVKDGRTLDLLNDVDTVVFDKTGTLTDAQPHVGRIYPCADHSEEEILSYAAAAEQTQTHPFAQAILKASQQRQVRMPPVDTEADVAVGYGLTAIVDGKSVRVGSLRFMEEMAGVDVPKEMRRVWEECSSRGHSVAMVAIGDRLIGAVEFLLAVRPESFAVIGELRRRSNIRSVYILSGDQDVPTRRVAQHLGVNDYFAETLPEDKAGIIERLQAEGRRVCYVGDGINDAIALKKSLVSISLRGASSVARDAAQIVLMDGTLNRLVPLFDLSQRFVRRMNTTFAVVVAPSLVLMIGATFLQFGFLHTVLIGELALAAGALCAVAPGLDAGVREADLVPRELALRDQVWIPKAT